MPFKKVIAIDGPAGAGKSTVARRTAKKLGYLYLDTGAIYRAITLKALRQKINFSDTKKLIHIARNSKIDLKTNLKGSLKVFLDKKDVSKLIRLPRVNKYVSDIAKVPGVRKALLCLQRSFAKKNNIVLEGRDIGTVVFPNADKKFFVDASFDERVKRRWKELKLKIPNITQKEIAKDLGNRDRIDSTRKTAPLKKAKDAIRIDTTNMSISEVVDKILKEMIR